MDDSFRKYRLPAVAIEVATIVFSVLFALGVDQFRQSRNEHAVASRVTETVRAEIADNRALVRTALAHHDSLLAGMKSGALVRRAANLTITEWKTRRDDRVALRTLVMERLADAGTPPSPGFSLRKTKSGEYEVLEMDMSAPIRIAGDTVQIFMPKGIQLRSALIRNTAWETAQATGALIRMPVPLVAALADLYQLQRTYQNSATDVLQSLYNNTFTVSSMQDLQYWETQLLKRYAAIERLLTTSRTM